MQQFRKHIAAILLLNFLMPQLLGSLHYILVTHGLNYEQEEVYTTADPGIQDHSCHYHLQSTHSFFTAEEKGYKILPEYFCAQENFGGLQNYVQQPDYNFQLRGPPAGLLFGIITAIQP